MTDALACRQILWLTGAVLAGFGLMVLAGSLAARRRGRSCRSMLVKYLAWLLMIPPILLPLMFSRTLFQAVVLLISLQCMREFVRVSGLWADRPMAWLCYALTAAVYVPVFAGWPAAHQAAPVLAIGLLVLAPIVRGDYEHMLQKVSLSMLGVLYFGWFLSHLACLRDLRHGIVYAFYLMVLVECNDAFAYLWGTWLGRHKLTPRISPNKTVEGAVLAGGSVLAVGYLLAYLLPSAGTAAVLLVGATVAVLGACGDLVVSFIKRDLRIKDMGAAIPGHGGVLDRCDSLILTSPVFFHLMRAIHGG